MLNQSLSHYPKAQRNKLFFFLFFPILVFSQNQSALHYSQFITAFDIKQNITVLASDSLEGRETGKPGQIKAANYIAKQFESYGIPKLGSSYFQNFEIQYIKPKNIRLEVNGKALNFGIDFYHKSDFQNISINAIQFTFYKSGDSVLQNSIIVTKEENINTSNLSFFVEKKVKAIFIIQDSLNYNTGLKSINYNSKRSFKKIEKWEEPIFYISEKVFRKAFKKNILKVKSKNYKCKLFLESNIHSIYVEGDNVLGYVEGSDLKDELVVVSAHYDHLGFQDGKIYYGADDNASGISAIIALSKAFSKAKKDGVGPRRSILFLAFSGEEMGLLGSSYYSENPIFPLENTIADLNIDMIGRIDEKHDTNANYVYVIGSDKLSSELDSINKNVNQTYTKIELDYTFNDPADPNRFYYRSDHYNFAKHNIPVIFYFNGVHADYHKATDTVDKINFDKVEKISKLVFFTAWELANRQKRIVVDKQNDFKGTR